MGLAEGTDVRGEVVFPERGEGLLHVALRQDAAQPDLEGPALPEDLVDLATVVRADAADVVLVGNLVVILAVEQFAIEVAAAALEDLADRSREFGVAHFTGHLLAGPQCRQVERAEPGDLAEPGLVERVVLGPFDETFALVHVDQALHGQLDPRPEFLEQGGVVGHLVFAIGAEDAAGLAIDRQPGPFAAMVDHARARVLCRAEIGPLAEIALQLGKQAGHGVGVVPDVRAGAFAAADALPAVEPARRKAMRGRGGQDRRVQERAIEEPVGKRRIVPGIVPEPGLGMERSEVGRQVLGDRGGIVEPRGIEPAAVLELQPREMPGDDEGGRRFLARFQGQLANDRTDELAAGRLRRPAAADWRRRRPREIVPSAEAGVAWSASTGSKRARANVPAS